MKPALIVHGHFYQPPRENPWTDTVDREPSAAPFHDWNARIHFECYRPNAYARIFDEHGNIEAIVNNYRRMSFNFGPTLLSWLEEHEPRSYRRILDADKQSAREHGGHGNAIAQAYNHAILPLLNDRDLRTQIRWGAIDFQRRFGRAAEGMWLPETACDRRTLAALIDESLRFAILAPSQAARIKDGGSWRELSAIEPRRPYRFVHPDGSGRSIALFFYDGPLSRAIAFEGLLLHSRVLVDRCEQASGGAGSVVQAVTDGESYGHHSRHGERCLAHALAIEAPRRGFWITNYGELLDAIAPSAEVDIALGPDGKGSSWSCAHGVGRWVRDCGCHTGGKAGWNQAWRTPLREALDLLRDAAAEVFETAVGDFARDPWAMRDDYAHLLCDRRADRSEFFARHGLRRLGDDEQVRALSLLEMQRNAMTMYTSCGWFFSDISGIEATQVLRYAARLIDQLRELGAPDPEARMLEVLAQAKSNLPEHGSGADLYRQSCKRGRATSQSVAAHVAMRRLCSPVGQSDRAGRFRYQVQSECVQDSGTMRLSISHLALTEESTGRLVELGCCALHLGGIDLHCLVKDFPGETSFRESSDKIFAALAQGSLLTVMRVAQEELGADELGIEHVLPNERGPLSRAIFAEVFERYAAHFEAMYNDSHSTLALFRQAGLPIPSELRAAAEMALGRRFEEAIAALPVDGLDEPAYRAAIAIAERARSFGCRLPDESARRHLDSALSLRLHRVVSGDTDMEHSGTRTPIGAVIALLAIAERLGVALDLERPQELLYDALKDGLALSPPVRELASALGVSPDCGR